MKTDKDDSVKQKTNELLSAMHVKCDRVDVKAALSNSCPKLKKSTERAKHSKIQIQLLLIYQLPFEIKFKRLTFKIKINLNMQALKSSTENKI